MLKEPTEGIQRKVVFTTMIFGGFSHDFLLVLNHHSDNFRCCLFKSF